MKKLALALSVVFFVLLPFIAGSINYRNKHFVIISYNVTIHPQIKEKLNALGNLFAETDSPKKDKIISTLTDYSWTLIEERLERETGLYILPLNTYGKQFDYDVYGYPNTSINKAIRRGTSKFYLRIDLTIEPDIEASSSIVSLSRISKDSSVTHADSTSSAGIRPKITINFTSFSEKGILPIEKFTGIYISPDPCAFESKVVDGIVNDKVVTDTSNLQFMIKEALTDLIKKIPSY